MQTAKTRLKELFDASAVLMITAAAVILDVVDDPVPDSDVSVRSGRVSTFPVA